MTGTTDTARLMDTIYRNQRHVYDLTRKYYLLGRDHLIARLQPPAGGTVLEMGCGTGRNLVAAARRYPDVRFVGLDISDQMLETARATIAKAGLSDRICLVQGDASDPKALDGAGPAQYDRVFYSYTLSMMPIWREAIEAGLARLSASGHLTVVDFGQQERLPGWFRAGLHKWLATFHVTPRADLPDVLALTSRQSGRLLAAQALYRGYAVYAELGPVMAEAHSPATK
ncbi:O-methyltransferase [Roseibium aquae]|uniref:O-methyltransferase n=1 Tax=Roseibium aquae TaxID=1323746 RepID=A0A916TKR1_9HYPH|nr:class I SAM-dependent methyltransferase [Roseibium aquae]GGB51742.1 O-methyltransferase [Roseibium aquae]